jgi:hypothetical protein
MTKARSTKSVKEPKNSVITIIAFKNKKVISKKIHLVIGVTVFIWLLALQF